MTKEPKKDAAKDPDRSKKPLVQKETVEDLDAGASDEEVKGGTTRFAPGDAKNAGAVAYC